MSNRTCQEFFRGMPCRPKRIVTLLSADLHASWMRSALIVLFFVLAAVAESGQNDRYAPAMLSCEPGNSSFSFLANTTWQSVSVRTVASPGLCIADVYISSDETPLSLPQRRLLLLVIITEYQSQNQSCMNTSVNTCTVTGGPWYLWADIPVRESMNATQWIYPLVSFTLAFVAAPAINLCEGTKSSLQLIVVNTTYVFAPDAGVKQIPPNNVTCSESSYRLTILAANSSSHISLSMLAAPRVDSCWALLYDGRSCKDNDIINAAPGQAVLLLYYHSSLENCSKTGTLDAFTVKADARSDTEEAQSITHEASTSGFGQKETSAGSLTASQGRSSGVNTFTSLGTGFTTPATLSSAAVQVNLSVVAGASAAAAAAAVAILTGLTVAIVIQRRRQRRHKSCQRDPGTKPAIHACLPSSLAAGIPSDRLFELYASPSQDQLYFIYPRTPSQDHDYSQLVYSTSHDHLYSDLLGLPPADRSHVSAS